MNEGLPTALWVSAQIRTANQSGIAIVARHKGDPTSGSVLLKINRLDGTANLFAQVRLDEKLVWAPVGPAPALPEPEADAYWNQEIAFDPDLWVVEVEDREGRLWFPGRVLETFG